MRADKWKIEHAVQWIMRQDDVTRERVLAQLIEYAIDSEWVDVWSEKDRVELASESGQPVSFYEAPYFSSCGEPLGT